MATDHTELRAWVLADAVRRSISQLIKKPRVREDLDFCSQARRAARSACRNVCEGFYRYGHPEFAHFVNIARGSLGELLDSIQDARLEGYLTPSECDALEDNIHHAIAVPNSLYTYLINTPTPPRKGQPSPPRKSAD